jgi:hypothetical protein
MEALFTFLFSSFTLVGGLNAATMVVTTTGTLPATDGADIASPSGLVDIGGNEGHVWNNRPRQGQVITTGSNPGGYNLDAYSVRVRVDQGSTTSPNWNIQVGSFDSGTGNVTEIALETATGVAIPNSTAGNSYPAVVTWSLDSPVFLAPNTEYAITVHAIDGGGFISLSDDTNPYGGGTAISGSIGSGSTANPYTQHTGADRFFHANIVAIPEPSSALFGLLGLVFVARRRR